MSAAGHFTAAIRDPAGNTLQVLELSPEDWRRIVAGLQSLGADGDSDAKACRALARDLDRDVVALLPETA